MGWKLRRRRRRREYKVNVRSILFDFVTVTFVVLFLYLRQRHDFETPTWKREDGQISWEKQRNNELFDASSIHLIFLGLWGGGEMPRNFRKNLMSLRNTNDGERWGKIIFRVLLWRLDPVMREVSHMPRRLQTAYESATPIQKADLARLLILERYGGWYLDLDTGIECDQASLRDWGGTKAPVARFCTNSIVHFLSGFLDAQLTDDVEAVMFWENGWLDTEDAWEQAKEQPCREGIPPYSTRLANYAMYARPGAPVIRKALALATSRLERMAQFPELSCASAPKKGAVSELDVLFSTGPDVLTEVCFGVRDQDAVYDEVATSFGIQVAPFHSQEVQKRRWSYDLKPGFQGITDDKVLILDPGKWIYNGNSFTWRDHGEGNSALQAPT